MRRSNLKSILMKGAYVLVLSVTSEICIRIGALGDIAFTNGLYAYVGSAQNNLEKRAIRHISKNKRKHWHIDYLLENDSVKVLGVFYKTAKRSEECKIAKMLTKVGHPFKRFGSSDCGCGSHLFNIQTAGFLKEFMSEMQLQSG